jgi:enoyl-CoA hydratase/carnithine racemase
MRVQPVDPAPGAAPVFIKLQRDADVVLITLNRPERLNAWHSPMRIELREALSSLDVDDSVRGIILTGAGDRAFSAGQDLDETQGFAGSDAAGWIEEWDALYRTIRSLSKPIVAALNGVAAGSAFQVALLCDIRVGHEGSSMGQPEIQSGIPSILGPWIMLDMLGRSRTIELVLTGRMMTGAEAHQVGLIHHLVDRSEVATRALEIAHELAAKPPVAMRLNKRRFAEVNEVGFLEAITAAKRISTEAFESGEPQEMMRRFFEQRRVRRSGSSGD